MDRDRSTLQHSNPAFYVMQHLKTKIGLELVLKRSGTAVILDKTHSSQLASFNYPAEQGSSFDVSQETFRKPNAFCKIVCWSEPLADDVGNASSLHWNHIITLILGSTCVP